MVVKKGTIGQGFSKRKQYKLGSIESPEDEKMAKEIQDQWALNDLTLTELCQRYAAELMDGKPVPSGTMKLGEPSISEKEWYAREISSHSESLLLWLRMLNMELDQKLSEGDVQSILKAAFLLGKLTRESELKFEHEQDAQRGNKSATSLRERRDSYNFKRKLIARACDAKYQEMAVEIWQRNSSLTKTAVAKIIANKTEGNFNTIRKKIIKLSSLV